MIEKEEWLHIYDLVGAAMEVYNQLGRGMQEPIYQEAFEIELKQRGIPYEREKHLATSYKGIQLSKIYIADFYSKGVVIELKSVEEISSDHRAQLFNYLRITKETLGVLINFGERKLRCERYAYNPEDDEFILLTKENYQHYVNILKTK